MAFFFNLDRFFWPACFKIVIKYPLFLSNATELIEIVATELADLMKKKILLNNKTNLLY